MAIYRVDYFKTSNSKYVMVEANSKREAINLISDLADELEYKIAVED